MLFRSNKGRPENLRPVKTKEEAQARGKQGGLKSVQVKKERKLLSQMYAEILADMYDIDSDVNIKTVVKVIMARADSSTVSLIKEMREATEGSKITIDGELSTSVSFDFVDPPDADTPEA